MSLAYTLELLHFSDQEASTGAFVDAPALSAVLNALRAEDLFNDGIADNTLFLASGDGYIPSVFYQASLAVYGAIGIGDILIQNAMGLQASAFGNHEFDSGVAPLANLINGTTGINFTGTAYPYLSCNLNFTPDASLNPLQVPKFLPPVPRKITSSVVFTVGGEKIGVVGATTPTLRSITSAGNVAPLPQPFGSPPNNAELDALAVIIQVEVNGLIAANPGMNKVIVLAHMQLLSIEFQLAQRLRNVDIIVAGGSHSRLFDADDRARVGDSKQGDYPTFFRDLDNKTVAVVNTGANYKYLGRLVIGFDATGNLIPSTYNVTVSGAYATDAQGVAFVNSTGNAIINPVVADVAKQLELQVIRTESNILGSSNVFLNGNRGVINDPNPLDGVRTQETNLGDLTADANLWYARFFDPTVTISIKNGGGIRANIGIQTVLANTSLAVRVPNEELKFSNGTILKPFAAISQNDVATALAFNNALSLVTVTRTELKGILEYGIGALRDGNGRMCQVGGVQFSFDSLAPVGSRIITLRITSVTPPILVVSNGAVVGNASDSFRVVTLGFLLDAGSGTGGDGYTFPLTGRLNLTSGGTGTSSFAPPGTEQDAMAEFLLRFHNSTATAYNQADTDRRGDLRMVDLSFNPSKSPTKSPSKRPTKAPTDVPSQSPSVRPVKAPVKAPVPIAVPLPISPPVPASAPSPGNGTAPVTAPATAPISVPVQPPVPVPISVPVRPPVPVPVPVRVPVKSPTKAPSKAPTVAPTGTPTVSPVRGDDQTNHRM